MKILLVQVDGKMPNLALMKISSYYKSKGHQTGFAFANPDKVYVSCIFSKNIGHASGIRHYYPDAEFHIGGPGLERPTSLPPEMDCVMPDYDLYPDMDYSIGYTQRGCPNNCPFCIVPKIEGSFREVAHISEFHNLDFDKLVLYDNNFLYSKLWREKLNYIKENGLKVSFNQGLDARLMDEEKAAALADNVPYDLHLDRRRVYFAWDLMENEKAILRGIQNTIDAGIKPYKIMVYMLVGFNTTHEEDMYRFQKLRDLKVDPFVMIYNNRRDDKWIRHFARYVIGRVYKKSAPKDYKPYNLALATTQNHSLDAEYPSNSDKKVK